MRAKGIIIFFYYFNLVYTKPQPQDATENFWKFTNKPGELLKALDTITSSAYHLIQPVRNDDKGILTKENEHYSRLKRTSEDSIESLEEEKPYDYEKAYDEFVKKYFEDSLNDAHSASDSTENADIQQHEEVTYSGEDLTSNENLELLSEASKKSTRLEKCKNITRGQEYCFICKNLRNGETSESCSFNKETKPQSYKFETKKNYRKYRATPENNKEKKTSEYFPGTKLDSKQTTHKSKDASNCIINKIENIICYYCENSKGDQEKKCYAEEIPELRTSKKQYRQK